MFAYFHEYKTCHNQSILLNLYLMIFPLYDLNLNMPLLHLKFLFYLLALLDLLEYVYLDLLVIDFYFRLSVEIDVNNFIIIILNISRFLFVNSQFFRFFKYFFLFLLSHKTFNQTHLFYFLFNIFYFLFYNFVSFYCFIILYYFLYSLFYF